VADHGGVSRAFDAIGAYYSEAFADKPGQVEATDWVIAHLEPGATVLDVGCGSGVPTARRLADAGMRVIGVDTSPVMLELARKAVPEGIFVEREMHDLGALHPLQERFDAAVAFFSLLMLRRADIGKALDAIRDVLAPDAVFAIGMVEGDTDYLMREFLGVPVPLTAYPKEGLKDLLAHHGFTVLELNAEISEPLTRDGPAQTHLYARCRITPVM
jgi:SAM-dependent methyltransferase